MLFEEYFLDLLMLHLFVHRRLDVRVNIELLSISNPVHRKVCGLVMFVSFIVLSVFHCLTGQIGKGKAK
uniref:Uncharacterized protein n=1 Tax=Anser cygnoides TaxID=8845 RepID=A0A8B9DID9_ANSCY